MSGGALVGDLIWENSTAGEVTVLDRTVAGYPQGWLLAAVAMIGFVVALLLVASVRSIKARRDRRRQFRSMQREVREQGFEPDHASWLDEPSDRRETAADAGGVSAHHSEPLYEQTRQAHQPDDRRQR
jgi:type II secretory pathway pseudopilin PulG